MSTIAFAKNFQCGPGARRALAVAAVCAAFVVAGEGRALASAGCTQFNGSIAGGVQTAPTGTTGAFAAGDTITIAVSVADGVAVALTNFVTNTVLSGPTSTGLTYVFPAAAPGGLTGLDTSIGGTGLTSLSVLTWSCTPAGTVGSGGGSAAPTNSQNIRSLQTGITRSAASVSGQAVSSQVSGAISDAFGNSNNPVSVNASGVAINFSAEPASEVEKRTEDAFSALAYAGNAYKAPPRKSLIDREWSAWLDLRGTGWDTNKANFGTNGNQLNLTGGIGRKLTPDLLVGLYGGYEYMKYSVAALAGDIKGSGGGGGGYLGWRMTPTMRFDASLGYTRLDYSAVAGTAKGSFDGNRLVASAALTGNYAAVGGFRIEPSASVYSLWEKQGAWTDSLGTAQADRSFSAGRAALGSKLFRSIDFGDITISPYAGFYGDWRFSSDNAVASGTTIVGIGNGLSGRVTSGVLFTGRSGASVVIGGDYGGVGADYKIWSGNVRGSVPF